MQMMLLRRQMLAICRHGVPHRGAPQSQDFGPLPSPEAPLMVQHTPAGGPVLDPAREELRQQLPQTPPPLSVSRSQA
jgi:hypothetical protein